MTAVERTDNAELIFEAKSLGIKQPHMCKLQTLIDRVFVAKEQEALEMRSPAPEVIPEVVEEAPVPEVVEEVLVTTVAEKPVEAIPEEDPLRKPPPKADVAGIHVDARKRKIKGLEAQYPGSKFLFQSSQMTVEQLEAKGMRRTKHRLGNDIIVQTEMESFKARKAALREQDRRGMDAIDDEGLSVLSLTAKAKVGRN